MGAHRGGAKRAGAIVAVLVLAVSTLVAVPQRPSNVVGGASATPPGRITSFDVPSLLAAGLAYDAADGYTLLWGGDNGVQPGGNNTETWSFLRGSWSEVRPPISPPGSSYTAALAYDAADGYVLLYELVGIPLTWTYAHGVWTNLTGSIRTPPTNLQASGIAYDPETRSVVLLGETNDAHGQTWSFSAGQWTNRTTQTAPYDPAAGTMAWDGALHGIIFVSAHGPETLSNYSGLYCNGTWLYSSGVWNSTSFPTPCAEYSAPMGFDPETNQMVLLGTGGTGNCDAIPCDATWILSSSGWRYEVLNRSPSLSSPAYAPMAYDAADGYLVLYGGNQGGTHPSDRTWTFQNGTWSLVPLPPGRPAALDVVPYVVAGVALGAVVLAVALWRRRWRAISAQYEAAIRDLPPLGPS